MMRYILISVLLVTTMPLAFQAQEEDKINLVTQIHQKIKDKQDQKRKIKREKNKKIKKEKAEQSKKDEAQYINDYNPFDPLTAHSMHAGTRTHAIKEPSLEDQGHPQNHKPRLNEKVNRVHENLRW